LAISAFPVMLTSHTMVAVVLELPVMTRPPSGEKATPPVPLLVSCAGRLASSKAPPRLRCQTLAVPSSLAVTTRLLSGLQSTS
jgi:hypothetical protein